MHGWVNADDRLRFKSAATVSAAKIERIQQFYSQALL